MNDVRPWNVLIIDDNAIDAEQSIVALRESDLIVDVAVVADEVELRRTVRMFEADVVLCDFAFPRFDGFEAVAAVREVQPYVPIIFVSGTISERQAVMALHCGAVDYVLKSNLTRLPTAVRRAIDDARELTRLRGSLTVAELRAEHQIERLSALWRITNDSSLQGSTLLLAMLTEAAAALRSPQPFGGVLSQLDGDTLVVIQTTKQDDDGRGRVPDTGARIPVPFTLASIDGPRTQLWDDLSRTEAAPPIAARLGWRSVISTRLAVGSETYFLTFGSLEPLTRPFSAQSIAYVELVASALATRLHLGVLETSLRASETKQRFQAERLAHIWDVANQLEYRDEDLWPAVLRAAAAHIRPGVVFRAWFSRLDGDSIVQELIVSPPEFDSPDEETDDRIAARVPLRGTILEKLLATGDTVRLFDDLWETEFATERARSRGWRALLMTAFPAVGEMYVLTFVHSEPNTDPFDALDYTYLQLLKSFFARHARTR